MEKKNILFLVECDIQVQKSLQDEFKEANFIFSDKKSLQQQDIQQADCIIGNCPIRWLASAEKLQWLHLESAGSEQYVAPGVLADHVVLTNSTGAYGPAIAEHMLTQVMVFYKKTLAYHKNQELRTWKNEGKVKSLSGSVVVIVGLGDIGREFGWRMKALGCKVIGVKRTPSDKLDYVDELVLTDQIDQILPQADIIAACLPSTSSTQKFFDERRLSLTKKDSVFINVGRGVTVDTQGLCNLAMKGHFLGVSLDVVDPEPLPLNHPLWGLSQVVITPHVSGNYNQQSTYDTVIEMIRKQLRLYLSNRAVEFLVDRKTGYRQSGK